MDENVVFENKIKRRVFVLFGNKYKSDLIEKLTNRLRRIDFIIFVLAWVGAFLSVASCEKNMTFNLSDVTDLTTNQILPTEDPEIKNTIRSIRIVNSTITFIIILFIVSHYVTFIKMQKIKILLPPEATLLTSKYFKWMLLEIFLNIWHTPPLPQEYSISISQRNTTLEPANVFLDNILTCVLLFCRSYHIIKIMAYNSKYNTYEVEKICLECNTPLNLIFLIKAEFKDKPFSLVGWVMAMSVFVFGYSVRSIEMFFMYGGDLNKVKDWRYYWNGMWCVIVTMSTVGFGDFFPISVLGRAIIVISCFWGTFLISLMVAALTVSVQFNSEQSAAYQSIKAARLEIKIGTAGTQFIQIAWRYRKHLKLIKENPEILNDSKFKYQRANLFYKFKNIWELFNQLRKSKNEKIKSIKIQQAVRKIDENLNQEMDKIRLQAPVINDVKNLLNEYENNQILIKQRCIELYKEYDEISILKENYFKVE